VSTGLESQAHDPGPHQGSPTSTARAQAADGRLHRHSRNGSASVGSCPRGPQARGLGSPGGRCWPRWSSPASSTSGEPASSARRCSARCAGPRGRRLGPAHRPGARHHHGRRLRTDPRVDRPHRDGGAAGSSYTGRPRPSARRSGGSAGPVLWCSAPTPARRPGAGGDETTDGITR
jgi:hypothetical protein